MQEMTQTKKLPFIFVAAFVCLYGSMTCLGTTVASNATEHSSVVVQKSPHLKTIQFANTPPTVPPTPPAEVEPVGTNLPPAKRGVDLVRFMKKLREFQISMALLPIARPNFIRGIYLTNNTAMQLKTLKHFVDQSQKNGVNTLVIDAQGKMLTDEHMSIIKTRGLFPVARIVCFELGLKNKFPDGNHVNKILVLMEESAKAGFREIQLDYIRYADYKELQRLPLKFKYEQINGVLTKARNKANELGVELSADVFGRITLNENDHIGQKLENFGQFVHTLYPMVYPSHYYGDPAKIANPYGTVKEGVENSKERIPQTRIVAYIQGFGMSIQESGLSLSQYVYKQFKAVDDAKGDGWVVWNARNDYSATWAALRHYQSIAQNAKLNPPKL